MKTKICLLFLLGFFFLAGVQVYAQKEYSFASSGQQKLVMNPSFAGSSKGLNVQTVYANNYSMYIPVVQYYTGVDYGFKNGFGMGLSFTKHDYGNRLYQSNQVDLSGAYKVKLKNNITLTPSLQFSYLQMALDLTKANLDDLSGSFNYTPYKNTNYSANRLYDPWGTGYSGKMVKQNVSLSSGFIMDINHKITFGVSFYDINQPDVGLMGVSKKSLTQIYHVSGILFKEKTVSLQPYSILKLQHYAEQFWEGGSYTTYKMLSLQTAFRTRFDYNAGDPSSIHNTYFGIIAGASLNYKKCKFGYTFKSLNSSFKYSAHEIFFAARLGNNEKKIDRAFFTD